MDNSSSLGRQGIVVLPLFVLLLASCGAPPRVTQPTPASSAISTHTLEDADTYLSHLAATNAFRGSVLLARGGSVLLSKGYGPADEEQQIPNTPQTRFRVGSITKQFTAMGILILQDEGRLHVQDVLCRYIQDCPADWQPITLHQLLTHTSGIPDFTSFPDFSSLIGTPVTVEQLIARFKDKPLDFPPGSRWQYSNSGYILLGYIIEQTSGEPYAQFLQERIFGPLQMHSTGYDSNTPQLPEHATGYLSPHIKPAYIDMSEAYAAGALYSTVEDLYRWDQALQNHQLVSRQSLDAMFTVQIPCPVGGCDLASDKGYGYGWFIADQFNRTLIYHVGHIDGFLGFNGFYPEENVDVVVLGNMDSEDVLGISIHLSELIFG